MVWCAETSKQCALVRTFFLRFSRLFGFAVSGASRRIYRTSTCGATAVLALRFSALSKRQVLVCNVCVAHPAEGVRSSFTWYVVEGWGNSNDARNLFGCGTVEPAGYISLDTQKSIACSPAQGTMVGIPRFRWRLRKVGQCKPPHGGIDYCRYSIL